ncbi:hypothetical protein CAEBREN_14175 [Caenorhabditis brenneri]|uniref:Uncharacterized protein n=1 Tax=Caenorhabditis brenneri TaxID=135651 RepID=G0MYB5_CAEBE|nr:hypothetical protein CAEBREN_14175 [Caenorhabditis brenneri]
MSGYGRKKKLIVCEINGNQEYKVLEASPNWVEFGTYLVRATAALESVWKEDRELWSLIQKSRAPATGDNLQSFRTSGKNYVARDTTTGDEHEIDSILVLPGGDLLLSWKTFPAHLINVDRNDVEDEDALRARIGNLQAQLVQKDLEIHQLRLLVQNQGEVENQGGVVVEAMEAVPEVQELVDDLINEVINAENNIHGEMEI